MGCNFPEVRFPEIRIAGDQREDNNQRDQIPHRDDQGILPQICRFFDEEKNANDNSDPGDDASNARQFEFFKAECKPVDLKNRRKHINCKN